MSNTVNGDVAESFTRTMGWNTTSNFADIAGSIDMGRVRVVADLGAGESALTVGLRRAYARLTAIVFELPAVLPYAKRRINAERLDDCCAFVRGSPLDAVLGGADMQLLKSVIHNRTDDAALRILRNCRDAMGSGRLVVIERAIDPAASDSGPRDLTMLVPSAARTARPRSTSTLLREAGFDVVSTARTSSNLCIIEAVTS